jgi:hypothetical protein
MINADENDMKDIEVHMEAIPDEDEIEGEEEEQKNND